MYFLIKSLMTDRCTDNNKTLHDLAACEDYHFIVNIIKFPFRIYHSTLETKV